MDKQLEKMIENRIRKVIREENALLLSAMNTGTSHSLQLYLQNHENAFELTQGLLTNREPEETEEELVEETEEEPPVIDYSQTKGIHKKTIQTAEIVADILREQGELRLVDLRDEVKRRGGDLGANPTIRMKSILKVSPVIKKSGHGRFKYEV
ncbi:Rok-like winged helix domain-containing protein [Desmospora profundinema]